MALLGLFYYECYGENERAGSRQSKVEAKIEKDRGFFKAKVALLLSNATTTLLARSSMCSSERVSEWFSMLARLIEKKRE